LQAYRPLQFTLLYNSPEKQQSIIREGTIRDVVSRDITNTTVRQMRGVQLYISGTK
jgi:hypothetical protein